CGPRARASAAPPPARRPAPAVGRIFTPSHDSPSVSLPPRTIDPIVPPGGRRGIRTEYGVLGTGYCVLCGGLSLENHFDLQPEGRRREDVPRLSPRMVSVRNRPPHADGRSRSPGQPVVAVRRPGLFRREPLHPDGPRGPPAGRGH